MSDDPGKSPEGDDETAQPEQLPRLRLVGIVIGCLLFVVAVAGVTLTEGRNGEFGYGPFTPEPLPFAAMRGFTIEQLVAHAARIFLATPALLFVWLGVRAGAKMRAPDPRLLGRLALAVSAASITLIAFFVLFVFRGKAIVNDELAYRMQSELLSEGRLALRGLDFLSEGFTVPTRLGFTGKYLFGEPLVQIPTLLLGYPALVHVPIAALTLWAFHAAVKRLASAELAWWSVILLASSPMFILTSATAQSQATSLLCVVVAALGYALVVGGRSYLGALLVGMGIGFGMTVRIQVAVPVGAVLVPMTAWSLVRAKKMAPLALLIVILASWATAIAGYDYALTGSPWKLPWFLEASPDRYGFGQVWPWDTFRHTPLVALENLVVTTIRFNAWWLGWPSSLLLIVLWFRYGRPLEGARVWLLLGLSTILFELGYYSTGVSDTGPIYHYELMLAGALLGANTIREGFARNARSAATLLFVQFGLGSTSFLFLEASRVDRLVHTIHDEVDEALSPLEKGALVLYEPRCTESLEQGWVLDKFPARYRADRDPIVTLPRPPSKHLASYLRLYPTRSCFYFHRNPMSLLPVVRRCEDVTALFSRPISVEGEQCPWVAPTATRLGLYDPWPAIKARALRKRAAQVSE